MPRLDSALTLVVFAASLATLAGCRDEALPARLLTPKSPLRTENAIAPVVNSLADDGDGTCTDTKCTLRDAIQFAGFQATITFSVTGTITLPQGDLEIGNDLTISGPGADRLAVSGNHRSRVFVVGGHTSSISGLTIENGLVSGGSPSFFGGGIINFENLTLTDVTIAGNNSEGLEGGGIYNASVGVLTVVGSTISGNASGTGGGITNDGTATIVNSTISNDSAVVGGAIANSGSLTLVNTTVAGNVASGSTAGIASVGGQVTLSNTIVANNSQGGNCSGPITTDGGYNIEDAASCGFTAATSLSNTNPGLDPTGLVNNGGPTATIALLLGGSAVDLIPFGTNGCGTTITADQRGVARPFNGACDVGAYELNFKGFLPPINNVRTNPIHPGKGVPIQFSLGGDHGLAIFAAGSPSSAQIACPLSDASSEMVPTVTAGNSGLSYDPATDTYTYVWKTDNAWGGTCRRLFVTFADGSVHTAAFSFDR